MPVVNRLVGHVLKVFVKNYTDKNLRVDLVEGDVVLRGVELDELVLAALLQLPPNLELRRVSCGFLHVHVPWRKLRSESVQLLLEVLLADVVEVPVPSDTAAAAFSPRPLPPQLAKLLRKGDGGGSGAKSSKRRAAKKPGATTAAAAEADVAAAEAERAKKAIPGFIEAIIEGISVQIKGVYFSLSLLGPPEDGDRHNMEPASSSSDRKRRPLPPLAFNISSLSIVSANSKWEPVPLAAAAKEGRRNGEVVVWKLVNLGAVTVEMGRVELFRLNPSIFRVMFRRKATETIPTDINIIATVPLVSIGFPGELWKRTLETLEDVMWLLNTAKRFAAAAAQQRNAAVVEVPQATTPGIPPAPSL